MTQTRARPDEVLTERVIGCAYAMSNGLGSGFLEKVSESALVHELGKAGARVVQQATLAVRYDGVIVGDYAADLLVEDVLLVELKACHAVDDVHVHPDLPMFLPHPNPRSSAFICGSRATVQQVSEVW